MKSQILFCCNVSCLAYNLTNNICCIFERVRRSRTMVYAHDLKVFIFVGSQLGREAATRGEAAQKGRGRRGNLGFPTKLKLTTT